jgi:transcriptional regulator with XRE-family HTH domain
MMTITNEFIGTRIREARNQRKKTQADLADLLGKSTGAISQLEKGMTQVSVVELAQIADYLNKPIEFFYGEDYIGDDVQAIIAIFRKMDFETRSRQAVGLKLLLEMQELGDLIRVADESGNEGLLKELGIAFYNKLIPFVSSIQEFSSQGKDMQETLAKVLDVDDIQKLIDE